MNTIKQTLTQEDKINVELIKKIMIEQKITLHLSWIKTVLYTHMHIHLHIHAEYILRQWINTKEDFFKKIYLSLYLKGCVWQGVEDWTKTAIYWPPLLWPSALCLSRSPGLLNRRPGGPASLLDDGFLYSILSPTSLISNSLTSCDHRVI